jgi:pyruvyltransferase
MKVFWSRCGHGHGNFGDKLTPLILDYLNIPYEWSSPEKADLIGVGSLLEKVPDGFKGVIWTTGNMFEETIKSFPDAEVLAVRGRFSLDRTFCQNKQNVVLGDGGLLCDLFFEPTPPKFKLGLIPHFADQKDMVVALLASTSPAITVIDICAPTLRVIQKVGECECILSSSLHGLILADSLGVPNHWMELGPATVLGAGFKFRDYYSAFGLKNIRPVHLWGGETLATVLSRCPGYHRPGINEVKQRLKASLEVLAQRFGGDNKQRRSLQELREREQRAAESREAWNREVKEACELMEQVIPRGSRFVLIDNEELRCELQYTIAVPLITREGEYWGLPNDDTHAVAELKRHLHMGITHVAIARGSFWWFDAYPNFTAVLREKFFITGNSGVQIFSLKE